MESQPASQQPADSQPASEQSDSLNCTIIVPCHLESISHLAPLAYRCEEYRLTLVEFNKRVNKIATLSSYDDLLECMVWVSTFLKTT